MGLSLILDLLLVVLLAVTIGYAVILNRKLSSLRKDRNELQSLATNFGQATLRAEESIGRLKKTADALQERIDKAQGLRDDLAFLIDRAGTSADRLEEGVRASRGKTAPTTGTVIGLGSQGATGGSDDAIQPRSEAERELLRALRSAG